MVPSRPSQLDIKTSENLDGIFPKYSHTYKIEICLEKKIIGIAFRERGES